MRIEQQGDTNVYDVYVRQSWLKDATMCNERGRHGMVRGDWNLPNELTAFGTGAHAAFELKCNNPDAGKLAMYEAAMDTFNEIANSGQMRWIRMQAWEIPKKMNTAIDNWMENIRPHVKGDILGVEHHFTYPMDSFMVVDASGSKTINVHGTGTIDLVTSEELWDWKTAARKYKPAEKQKVDIQTTMYGGAAVAAGWATWPLTFNFGVVIRDGGAQIVPVTRDASHMNWLKRITRPLVRNAFMIGMEEEWSMNDTHFLCSENWCPFWSVCRGCHSQ